MRIACSLDVTTTNVKIELLTVFTGSHFIGLELAELWSFEFNLEDKGIRTILFFTFSNLDFYSSLRD